MSASLLEAFSSIEDPRVDRHKLHKLIDIIVLTICAVISGAEGWEDIEQFGITKREWLQKWIALENGIPSHDCIARVIARIPSVEMSKCFVAWASEVAKITTGEVVAIDGKTARHSYNCKDKLGAIHMVSAWANKAGMSLGQVKTEKKSNEITAIPVLLEMLEIKGCIITIDAMGCQTNITKKIIEKKADYVLAVKGNQKRLHEAIIDYFEVAVEANNPKISKLQRYEEINAGHGRIETRRFYLSTCLDTLPDAARWKGLKSIGMVESERTFNGRTSVERRHYICSVIDVKSFAHATRAHWGVENSLHWVLDVTFKEDDSRIRTGYAPENFNVIRQFAINLLKKEPSKMSMKKKRFKAALNDEFRKKVIFSS
ncbi:MAG: ISAs1 family transposase [Methylococcales bacterium]|nr:ISAs1 family transposase [Methylococcales bacterium]